MRLQPKYSWRACSSSAKQCLLSVNLKRFLIQIKNIKQNSKHKNAEFNNRPILAGEDLTPKNPLERERRLRIHREQRRKKRQQQTISLKIWAKIAVTKHVLLPDAFIPYQFMHQSIPAAPSLPPGGYCGAFANLALPGGRAFANPELLTRARFPIRI